MFGEKNSSYISKRVELKIRHYYLLSIYKYLRLAQLGGITFLYTAAEKNLHLTEE